MTTGRASRTVLEYTFPNMTQEELGDIEIYNPISSKQEKYLNDESNDIIVWGGAASSGKTQVSLLRLLVRGLYDKDYVAAVARRSQKQMKSAGSLWTTGTRMFAPHGVSSNHMELSWKFRGGAEVKCHHLDDNQDDYQGTQCTEFLVDEAQQCKEEDVWYLTSRLRSKSRGRHQLRLTCNPLNTSFLFQWLNQAGYLLDNGLPNPEMDGVTTFMVQVGGEFEWRHTLRQVKKEWGDAVAKTAQRFVYYAANVYDNPYIVRYLPEYVTKLENLKTVDRERLLLGNWLAKSGGEGFVKSEWFNPIKKCDVPLDLPVVRCWDFASTLPHEGNKNPDWTRGSKATYDKSTGDFYILDLVGCRDRPAVVQRLLMDTAIKDGRECYVGIPIDAGAAGRVVADQKKGELMSAGRKVVLNATTKSKLARAEPFLIALQEGKVHVVEGVFTKANIEELEAFDGGKNSGMKDDILDTLADCYNMLTSNHLLPTIRMGNLTGGGGGGGSTRNRIGGRTLL